VGHVARLVSFKQVLIGKLEGKRSLGKHTESNIKTIVQSV
jgi:hypothetical protein